MNVRSWNIEINVTYMSGSQSCEDHKSAFLPSRANLKMPLYITVLAGRGR